MAKCFWIQPDGNGKGDYVNPLTGEVMPLEKWGEGALFNLSLVTKKDGDPVMNLTLRTAKGDIATGGKEDAAINGDLTIPETIEFKVDLVADDGTAFAVSSGDLTVAEAKP